MRWLLVYGIKVKVVRKRETNEQDKYDLTGFAKLHVSYWVSGSKQHRINTYN